MNISDVALIQSVYPSKFSTSTSLNSTIRVSFIRDIDVTTLNNSTVLLEKVGVAGRLSATLSYSNKILTITPSLNLEPSVTYRVTLVGDNIAADAIVTGIRDITGNGMRGDFVWTFTTTTTSVLSAPILRVPDNQSAILIQPTFTWTAVGSADHYDIQVSQQITFETTYWPLGGDIWDPNQTTITPSRAFADGEFYWRVRAIDVGNSPGVWSDTYLFYKGDPTIGAVVPEDVAVTDFITPASSRATVYSVWPAADTTNMSVTAIPYVEIKVYGTLNLEHVTTLTFTVTGIPTNMDISQTSAVPYWTPSLNGSVFFNVGGGLASPWAVDSVMRIQESGVLSGTLQKTYDATTQITTIRLIPPAGYFEVNNRYVCVLDVPGLSVQWWFTTRYSPLYSTVKYIRSEIGNFIINYTDDDLNFLIWDASIYSMAISKFPPTYIEGGYWYWAKPIAFNEQDPPFYVKQYVRSRVNYKLMHREVSLLASEGGRKRLGDLEYETGTESDRMLDLLKNYEKEMNFWEKKVMGLTRLGAVKPQYAQRGYYPFDYRGRL